MYRLWRKLDAFCEHAAKCICVRGSDPNSPGVAYSAATAHLAGFKEAAAGGRGEGGKLEQGRRLAKAYLDDKTRNLIKFLFEIVYSV